MAALAASELTLMVPGLFGPAPPRGVSSRGARETLVEGLELGALESLLARARRARIPHAYASPEDLCFGAFGYRREVGSDWPVAAVTRHADVGDGRPGWYLRADPVHLKADMSDLVLFDGQHFALDVDEARALAATVAGQFEHENWRFEVPHPLRWYLRLEQPQRITTAPLSLAALKPVTPHLPAGEEAARWRTRMNEIQMILHASAINRAREARGELPVNSLWFWGGGTLPGPAPATFSLIYADQALARGLAALAGIRSRPLPPGGAADIPADANGESMLVVLDQGWVPARASDVDAWRQFLSELEHHWFGPVDDALNSGALRSLTLLSDRPVQHQLGPARWWHRFRRPRSFADLAET